MATVKKLNYVLNKYFKNRKDVKMTDSTYYRLTGEHLPSNLYYLKNESSIYKSSKYNNYKIVDVIDRTVIFRRSK